MDIKYIVFDRDGTLIKHKPYLYKPKEVELLPYVPEGLKKLKKFGYKFLLHTNQSGVARGYFTKDDAIKCNHKMIELIDLGENLFEKICIATDYPPLKNSYRKPSPRFGEEVISKFNVSNKNLFYVGDSISDLETAENIDCVGLGINTGEFDLKLKIIDSSLKSNKIFKDFRELTHYLINN
tara:strand:- start:13 stop:555 length:543 start_codon:yes stop_codon:yes gene_type:complete